MICNFQASASCCSLEHVPLETPTAQSRDENLSFLSLPDLLGSFKQVTLSPALYFPISLGRITLAAHPANIF